MRKTQPCLPPLMLFGPTVAASQAYAARDEHDWGSVRWEMDRIDKEYLARAYVDDDARGSGASGGVSDGAGVAARCVNTLQAIIGKARAFWTTS
ncbi:MAG: hypothetical protein J7498_15065 [Sphingobium sp.]|nr:hypothetical protein [Sphingobium sp.]